jgi:L-cysteine/cystine lyase
VDRARADLPVTARLAHLNTGAVGPLPQPAYEALVAAAASEVLTGRLDTLLRRQWFADLQTLRAALGGLIGVPAGSIGLTHSTTEAVALALDGLDWQPGDTILTTSLEHAGVLDPLAVLHRRRHVSVEIVDIGNGSPSQVLAAFKAALHPGVRAVAVSHVTWSTGAVLPIKDLARQVHANQSFFLVDGAQSVGAIPVHAPSLDVDAYAFSGQKWLCGPDGTGALYVHPGRQAQVAPPFIGLPNPYDLTTSYKPLVPALLASLRWLAGQGDIFAAIAANAIHCRQALAGLGDVELLNPHDSEVSGLVCFRLPGLDLAGAVAELERHLVAIRQIPETNCLRISCGFFNTPSEIDRAVSLLASLR